MLSSNTALLDAEGFRIWKENFLLKKLVFVLNTVTKDISWIHSLFYLQQDIASLQLNKNQSLIWLTKYLHSIEWQSEVRTWVFLGSAESKFWVSLRRVKVEIMKIRYFSFNESNSLTNLPPNYTFSVKKIICSGNSWNSPQDLGPL